MRRNAIILIISTALTIVYAFRPVIVSDCNCDKAATEKVIKSKDFNKLPQFDRTLTDKGFYALSATDNRLLWYRDIENPKKTKFTRLWNDYARNNYHASHLDFIKYYQDKNDIELAFQFGPNFDLWAYHIFVVKKIDCCYLITRSYFRHARFTGKLYAILDKPQLDSLFSIIAEQKITQIDSVETFHYCGYFRDNRNKESFYIDFEKDQLWVTSKQDSVIKNMDKSMELRPEINMDKTKELRPEIKKLFDFVDEKINWTETYSI